MGVAPDAFARSACAASCSVMVNSVVVMVMSPSSSLVTTKRYWCFRAIYDQATRHDVTGFFYDAHLSHFDASFGLRCEQLVWSAMPMVQCANYAGLLTSLPTVEQVLDDHASELGHDFIASRNHVYRVANLFLATRGDSRVEREEITVGAHFHSLGIWTNNTFDYIAPSVAIARKHLTARGLAEGIPEIEAT